MIGVCTFFELGFNVLNIDQAVVFGVVVAVKPVTLFVLRTFTVSPGT